MRPNPVAGAMMRLHDTAQRASATDVIARLAGGAAQPRPDVHALLQCFAAWTTARAGFGEAEVAVVSAMDMENLLEAGWWARVVTAVTRGSLPTELEDGLSHLAARLDVVAASFPALAVLVGETSGGAVAGSDTLVLSMEGTGGEAPSLTRIATAIEGLNLLWAVAEDMTGQRGLLRLVSVEPGACTALHFDGLAEPLLELRTLLASVADKVSRLTNISQAQHPALIPGMLPIMDRIARIGRADALRVRLAVETGVRKLLEAGASLQGAAVAAALSTEPGHGAASALPTGPSLVEPVPDVSHLAEVIAEERRQLQPAEGRRRLWHGAAQSA